MKTLKNTFLLMVALAFISTIGFGQAKYQDIYTISGGEKVITATTTTQQQNLVFTGIVRHTYSVSVTAPSYQLFIRKTDANGNVLFYRAIGVDCELYPNSINQTADEGFIVSGTVTCLDKNMTTMFLLKLTKDGKVDWLKYYERNYTFFFGKNYNYSELRYAEEVKDGGYIATGLTEIIDLHTQQSHYATIVILTDANGNLVNRKILYSGQSSSGVTIKDASDGTYALLMEALNQHEQPSVVLLNNNLNEIWNKTISLGNNYLSPRDLVVTNSGEIVVGAMLYDMAPGYSYAAMIALDWSIGGINWQKSYYWKDKKDTYFPESLKVGENGDLYMAGEVGFETPSGYWEDDVFVLQTDDQGNLKRLTQYGQQNRPEYVQEISLFDNGEFFFGGFTHYFNSAGYLVKADDKGDSNCDFTYQEGRLDNYTYNAQSATLKTIDANIYIHRINATNEAVYSEINRCGDDLAKGKVTTAEHTDIVQPTINLTIDKGTSGVYPNPNNGTFNIDLSTIGIQKNQSLQLFNANGQLIKQLTASKDKQTYSFQGYPKGIYFLKVVNGSKVESHKIVVQ